MLDLRCLVVMWVEVSCKNWIYKSEAPNTSRLEVELEESLSYKWYQNHGTESSHLGTFKGRNWRLLNDREEENQKHIVAKKPIRDGVSRWKKWSTEEY